VRVVIEAAQGKQRGRQVEWRRGGNEEVEGNGGKEISIENPPIALSCEAFIILI